MRNRGFSWWLRGEDLMFEMRGMVEIDGIWFGAPHVGVYFSVCS